MDNNEYQAYIEEYDARLKVIKDKYPLLFEKHSRNGRKLNPDISIDFGWFPLFDNLCREIYDFFGVWNDRSVHGFRWVQVKEKFGGARFYYSVNKLTDSGFEGIENIIRKYESEACLTCEKCGERGELRPGLGWLKTLCDKHYQESLQRVKDMES